MPWKLPSGDGRPRTPGEQRAFIQGFRSGAGLAVEYTAQGKPLGRVLDLAAMLEEYATEDEHRANPDR